MKPYDAHIKRTKHKLSVEAEIVLDIIHRAEQEQGMHYTVSQVMVTAIDARVASPATVHKAIKDIEELGFTRLKTDKTDKRIKFCIMTSDGKKYLNV